MEADGSPWKSVRSGQRGTLLADHEDVHHHARVRKESRRQRGIGVAPEAGGMRDDRRSAGGGCPDRQRVFVFGRRLAQSESCLWGVCQNIARRILLRCFPVWIALFPPGRMGSFLRSCPHGNGVWRRMMRCLRIVSPVLRIGFCSHSRTRRMSKSRRGAAGGVRFAPFHRSGARWCRGLPIPS